MIQIVENLLFAERYVLKRMLGRGGFSEVWLGEDNVTKLEVAIKVYAPGQGLDADGMADFCKELSNVYNLNHTNLLKPQHVDSWQGMPYLVMTYCPKGSCQRRIGKFSEEELWRFLSEVSSGLAYLHQQEIIHQDIKPDNILIDPQGNYVVTDFGISVQARATLRKSMSASSGSGTTAYMGPERFSKEPNPIKASDIWSLGATAYELLTGDAPFGEIGGGLQKGGADIPTINKSISSTLRCVLSKMLASNPWERPTADQLAQWAANPKEIDFSGKKLKINKKPRKPEQENDTVTSDESPAKPQARLNFKWIFITVLATCIIFLGIVAGFVIHVSKVKDKEQKELEAKAQKEYMIKAHLSLKNGCERSIFGLNGRNFMSNVENTILSLRELEDFEKKNTPPKKFFEQEWKNLESTLSRLLDTFNAELEGPDAKTKWDMSGGLYREKHEKRNRAESFLKAMQNSQQKSAHDIHIKQDDL